MESFCISIIFQRPSGQPVALPQSTCNVLPVEYHRTPFTKADLTFLVQLMQHHLIILFLLLFHRRSLFVSGITTALCFLTRNPSDETLRFAQELAADAVRYDLHVFIMVDDNKRNLTTLNASAPLRLLQITNDQPLQHGFHQTISLGPGWADVSSWDKALFYFCVLQKQYEFVWLIEEDVFIPSARAVRSLHQLYANTSDLVIPRSGINRLGDPGSWLWGMTVGKFVPPWACSMVNMMGLSRRMLAHVHEYVRWRGAVPFHEFFFNTLAMQQPNLSMVAPTELSGIVYRAEYTFEQIQLQPNNMWHSLKDFELQKTWRER